MKEYLRTPVTVKHTTVPAKIQSLKFSVVPGSPYDDDYMDFEFIQLGFISSQNNLSPAEQYVIEIKDLDTGIVKKYIQSTFQKPYYYWQRSSEYNAEGEIISEEIPNGIVNARVFITPINDFGSGPRSSFILPLRNMQYITKETRDTNPTSLVLAKYWNLFSKTPHEIYNRPKQMHIYLGVSEEDIILDKELLSAFDWRFDTIGTYQEVNQEMFRWSVDQNYTKLDSSDIFIPMTVEEKEFINILIDSFLDLYRRSVSDTGEGQGEPHVFKITVENPADHNDSIIIYLMKGQRWQI